MTEARPGSAILTVPNLISFVRLIGVAFFWWVLLIEDDVTLAAWLIFVIGLTDWIDGFLARRLGQVSELGKVLDPVADRLMIASAVVGGLIVGVLPAWFGWGLITREVLVGAMALYLAARGGGAVPVRFLGKTATFALYGAIPAFYLSAAGVVEWLLRPVAWFLGIIGLTLYWVVAFLYYGDSRERLAALESPPDPEEV